MQYAKALLMAGMLAMACSVVALESDSKQPIHIESNSATYDDNQGTSTYTGNVQVNQGSMQLNADRLVVYINKGKIDKIVATGNPARFKQIPRKGGDEIRAKSLRAEYYAGDARLVLIDKAVVWQGKNTYASDRIEYDSKKAIVKAGQELSNAKRVHVTLQPKSED